MEINSGMKIAPILNNLNIVAPDISADLGVTVIELR